MKQRYSRILTWILVFVMSLGSVSTKIWATEKNDQFIELVMEEAVEDTEGKTKDTETNRAPEIIQIPEEVIINPVYEDVITADDLVIPGHQFNDDISGEVTYLTDYAVAGEIVADYMMNREEQFTIYFEVDDTSFSEVCEQIMEESFRHTGDPLRGDYLKYQWGGGRRGGSYYQDGNTYYYQINMTYTYYTTNAQENAVANATQNLLSSLNLDGKTNYEKAQAIYEAVAKNTTYATNRIGTGDKLIYTAYGALVQHDCVCQGYANAMYRLFLTCGIDIRIISSDQRNHAWNIAKVESCYYLMDCTWDSNIYEQTGQYKGRYFLKGVSDFDEAYPDQTNGTHANTDDQFQDEEFASYYVVNDTQYDPNAAVDEPEIPIIAEGVCGEHLGWTLNQEGILEIQGTGAMDNYTYTKEVPWYSYVGQISSIVISGTVTSIADYAFYGITNVKSVTIPNSVKILGEYAFKNCTGLEYIELSRNLTKLGESAFFGCSNLRSITIPEGIYTVWGYTFKNCTSLASISLPQTLIKIDEAAFYGCSALTALIIPDDCSIIGQYAFKNCTRLKNLTLPAKMTEIREAAFYATAVETLNVPAKVTKVGPYAFKNCTKLITLNLPETLTYIGESAFYGSSMSYLNLPDAVTRIDAYAFKGCEKLTEINFPANLVTIGDSAFYYCTSLVNVELPEKLTTIEGYAFKNCTSLISVTLPESLRMIGDSAFYSCTKLPEIIIPANVTSVGAYCFSKDTALKSITFLGNAPAIGASAFNNVTGVVYYPKEASSWSSDKKQNYGGTITWMGK